MARKPLTTTSITAISDAGAVSVTRSAALVVIHGENLGKKYDLIERAMTMGRSSRSDIHIDQESASRHHATLKVDGARVTIQDGGSTNGTVVNDEPISGAFSLRNGDFIKIGRTVFKFIASNNLEAAYHDEVYRLTTIDGLTQVFNRRYFEDTLEREIARCNRHHRPLSLVIFDIDFFKTINDTHGHLAGDAVLKTLATMIKSRVRKEDVLARYGGEEFVLLLPEISQKAAAVLADKMRKVVERHAFRFDDSTIPVTISAGVSCISKKIADPIELIRLADERLYEAKAGGRNQVSA